MTHAVWHSDEGELAYLVEALRDVMDPSARFDAVSRRFLDRPYLFNPLVGSAHERESFVVRLDGFDCVTYVETSLALGLARRSEDFERTLRALRYKGSRVDWLSRNHYMAQWLQRNQASGLVTRVLAHRWQEEPRARRLTALADYPPREMRLSYLPLERLEELGPEASTGDLVCFVSERPDLDTFHVGLLVEGEPLRLRHASQSAGRVVEETLPGFLERNSTPGLMIARMRVVGA